MCAVGVALAIPASGAVRCRVEETPLYGRTAFMESPDKSIEIALEEGARIVSWRVGGREIGFTGRFWGGDSYDSITLGDRTIDLKLRRPDRVWRIGNESGRLCGVRALFRLRKSDGAPAAQSEVILDRRILLTENRMTLDVRIARRRAGRQTGRCTYRFMFHLLNHGPDGGIAVLHAPASDEKDTDQPLSPKLFVPHEFIWLESRGNRDGPTRWRTAAVSGLVGDRALVFRVFAPADMHVRVWNASWRFDVSQTFDFSGGRTEAGMVAVFESTPAPEARTRMRTPPGLPPPDLVWTPVTFPSKPEMPRPEAEIARRFGPWGVHAGTLDPLIYPAYAAAGIRWVRMGGFGWRAVEPNRGVRDYSAVDAAVNAARAEGMAVIGEFHGFPGWATVNGDSLAVPRDLKQWESYVERTVKRFRDRVHVWEIWNEPDIGSFWHGTLEEYMAVLRHAYAGAKRADPGCKVMSAGLDGRGEVFLVRMAEHGLADCCDLVGAHPYAGTAEVAAYRMRVMRRVLDYFGIRKPLWITEVGWQSGGWKSGPGVVDSEETKAERLRQAFPLLRRYADVICWYTGIERGRMYGLMQPAGRHGWLLQPAWYALRDLALPAGTAASVTAPKDVRLEAGVPARVTARVQNRSDAPLRARWIGFEPEWSESGAVEIPPGSERNVTAVITPEAIVRPHRRDLLLALQKPDKTHLRGAVVRAEIVNEGAWYDVRLSGGWIRKIDRTGKPLTPWRPLHDIALHPGDVFVQPLRPVNLGNATDTFDLQISGDAARWVEGAPDHITLKPGAKGWIGLRIAIPKDARPGTYSIEASLRSRKAPGVHDRLRIVFSVRAP